MVVLFTIAMVCFFALFAMILVLMHQAKVEGAIEERSVQARLLPDARRERFTDRSPRAGFGLMLSNLVPTKQPDWRFMVRGGGRGTRSRLRRVASSEPRELPRQPVRSDRVYFNQDLGDISDPQAPHPSFARRA